MSRARSAFRLLPVALALLSCNRTPERTVELASMTHGMGAFFAVGTQEREEKTQGLVLRSGDGQTWSEVILAAPGTLLMMAPGGPGLVAVGSTLRAEEAGAAGSTGSGGSSAGQAGKSQGGTGGANGGTGGAAGAGGESAGTSGSGGVGGEAGAAGESGTSGQGGDGGSAGNSGTAGASGSAGTPGSNFTAAKPKASPSGLVMLSSDGIQWEAAPSPPGAPLLDVASSSDKGLVAVSRGALYWSGDGRVWLQQPVGSAPDETWSQVEASDERFVALGKRPAVSTDGKNWQPVTTVPEGEMTGLRYSEGAFYSVGRVGGFFGGVGEDGCVILRSTDGQQWAPVEGAAPGCAIDVARGNDQALVLTQKGVFEAPSFAGPWTVRSELEGGLPLRMEFGGGRWVIASRDGLWSSGDGKLWTQTFKP